MSDRKYDLVIFGATGFTGGLTCEYIAHLKDESLKYAIAGRNLAKLEKVKERLMQIDPSKTIDCLIADSNQPQSLDEVLSLTRVVLSTVGPFTKYGTPLVEACLRQKTHYVDTTGEHTWCKTIIDKYHEQAQQDQVIIVPTCGFDSVPSDLGVYMVAQYMQKTHHLNLSRVKASFVYLRGTFSVGTFLSLLETVTDKDVSQTQQMNPYLLATRTGVDKNELPIFKKDKDFNKWQAFIFMSVINEKVVRRSWSIWADRDKSYGRLFSYRETMALPFIPALIMTAAIYTVVPLFFILLQFPFINEKIKQLGSSMIVLPNKEKRDKGGFTVELVGYAENEPYDEPVRVRGVVKGFSDPGYSETCRIVAESALSIIKNYNELPGKAGGVLTPATAFGDVLIHRLTRNDAMVFEVMDDK